MSVEIECGQCHKRYRVGEQLAGKKLKCKACGHLISVPDAEFLESGKPLGVRGGSRAPVPKTPQRRAPRHQDPDSSEVDSFEAVAALAALEAGGRDASSDDPDRIQDAPPPMRRSRPFKDPPPIFWRALAAILFVGSLALLHFNGYETLSSLSALASTASIGLIVLLIGGILAFIAILRAGIAIIQQGAAEWDVLSSSVTRGVVGAILIVGGILLLQHPVSMMPKWRQPKVAANGSTNTDVKPVPSSTDGANANDATPANPNAGTPSPDTSGVPKVTSADAKAKGPRLTADGKPIPPPPVDSSYDPSSALAGDDGEERTARGQRAPTVPTILVPAEAPTLVEPADLRASDRPSPWVFIKTHGPSGDAWERYNATDKVDAWRPSGQLMFSDPWTDMIFSPSGEYLVRRGHAGVPKIQVWAFTTGQLVQDVDGTGMTDLVGFIDEDRFVVAGGLGATTLAIVSAKTGQKVAGLVPPVGFTFRGRDCSISPDGALVAAPAQGDPSPALLLYNASGGVARRITLPGFEKERVRSFITPEGSAFSADGKKVVAAIRTLRSSLVYVCSTVDGKILATYEYPDFTVCLHNSAARPQEKLVRWFGTTDCLLLKDYVVLDTATGRVVGCADQEVSFYHELGNGKVLLKHRGGAANPDRLDVCTFDDQTLKARLDRAKDAGPMQFDPADAPAGKFATIGAPKTSVANAGATPDPAPQAGRAVDTPVAIDATYGQIRKVEFSRAAAPAAIVALGLPGSTRRDWDPLRDPDFTLQRIDLATGKAAPQIHLPIFSQLLAISPDATLAVVASDVGDRTLRLSMARIDVVAMKDGKPTSTFVPYAEINPAAGAVPAAGGAAPVPAMGLGAAAIPGVAKPIATGPQSVVWAGMADNDTLLTLNPTHVLVRWSLGGRRATWARAGVVGNPLLTPGGKQVLIRTEAGMFLIDVKTGEAAGGLSPDPLVGAEVKDTAFSADGAAFYAATSNGLFRWDVKTGQPGNPLTTDPVAQLEDLGGGKLLADNRLFDLASGKFVFTYLTYGGRHLYEGLPGRHWYLARTPAEGTPYLCSAAIPTSEQLAATEKFAANPPLIRPGVQVVLQVNAGGASERVTKLLSAKLAAHRLDQGEAVATLRITAVESPTGEVVPFSRGMNAFRQDPNAEKVALQQYECYYDLVDAQDHVLYGSQMQVLRGTGIVGVMLKPGQTVAEKLEELLQNQVESWAATIYVPTYLTATGQIPPKPEATLGVELRGTAAAR